MNGLILEIDTKRERFRIRCGYHDTESSVTLWQEKQP